MDVNNSSHMLNSSAIQDLESRLTIPYYYKVFFILIYTIAAVLAIVGNVAMIVVVVRQRLAKAVRYAMTNLAVTYILTAVCCIPFTVSKMVYGQWFFSSFMCTAINYLQEVVMMVGALTLAIISIQRYLGLMHPFKYHIFKTIKAMIISIALMWMLAFAMSSVVAIYSHTKTTTEHGVSYDECVYEIPTHVGFVYIFARLAVLFVIPMTIITFTYSTIAWRLLHHIVPDIADAKQDSQHHQNIIEMAKMCILIEVLFAICFIPIQCYMLAGWFGGLTGISRSVEKQVFLAVYWFAMAYCFVDPIIYSFCDFAI